MILKLTGVFVNIMGSVNTEYKEYVIFEVNREGKRVKSLYISILRALYSCIESAILWYELYSSMQDMCFVLNLYNKYVANKVINGPQCTIIIYVNGNEISHKDPEVVTSIFDQIYE